MPTVLQFRRGTTSQNNAFTGAIGEITYDTTTDVLRIHDGSTAGGFAMVSASSTATLTNKTLTSPQITTSIIPSSADGATIGSASAEFSDLFLADGSTIQFGNDQEVKLTHVADTGLTLKHTATADDKPISLTLQTGETDIAVDDVLGKIDFQAPDEGTGTDAILVAAGIEAVSEGDFSGSNNATKLSFKTAASEAAAEKMKLSSTGVLTLNGGSGAIVIPDAGTIGSASDTNAIGISSGGVVSITATTANTSSTDGALTVGGGLGVAADASIGDDLRLISDAAVLSFGADSEITVTHDADVGLKFKHSATADDKPIVLTLQTGETDMAANDVIGALRFQAPDEGTGTDAITIAAAIEAVAEGDFSATSNATKISFKCGNSEAATEKAKIVGSTGKFHATPDSILLIKNSSGSTLKTVNGHAAI
tara:strand:- start:351 stop:1622 length:1272 start_codon:yes stop_codon:yes gene_type:complete